jgi:hypothetical protein
MEDWQERSDLSDGPIFPCVQVRFGDATANADTDNLHKSGNASSTMIRAGLADTLD